MTNRDVCKVWFLYEYDLVPGVVLRSREKTATILVEAHKGIEAHTRSVPLEKIVGVEEPFCVVWDLTKGRNGRGSYRIEREKYKDLNVVGWRPTTDYIVEN